MYGISAARLGRSGAFFRARSRRRGNRFDRRAPSSALGVSNIMACHEGSLLRRRTSCAVSHSRVNGISCLFFAPARIIVVAINGSAGRRGVIGRIA